MAVSVGTGEVTQPMKVLAAKARANQFPKNPYTKTDEVMSIYKPSTPCRDGKHTQETLVLALRLKYRT